MFNRTTVVEAPDVHVSLVTPKANVIDAAELLRDVEAETVKRIQQHFNITNNTLSGTVYTIDRPAAFAKDCRTLFRLNGKLYQVDTPCDTGFTLAERRDAVLKLIEDLSRKIAELLVLEALRSREIKL